MAAAHARPPTLGARLAASEAQRRRNNAVINSQRHTINQLLVTIIHTRNSVANLTGTYRTLQNQNRRLQDSLNLANWRLQLVTYILVATLSFGVFYTVLLPLFSSIRLNQSAADDPLPNLHKTMSEKEKKPFQQTADRHESRYDSEIQHNVVEKWGPVWKELNHRMNPEEAVTYDAAVQTAILYGEKSEDHKGRLSNEETDRMINDADQYQAEEEKQEDRVSAKKSLESYCFNIKNIIEEENIKDKISEDDHKLVGNKWVEIIKWLNANQLAEKEEFEDKQKELEKICNPVITKLYAAGGALTSGMPGTGGFPGEGKVRQERS